MFYCSIDDVTEGFHCTYYNILHITLDIGKPYLKFILSSVIELHIYSYNRQKTKEHGEIMLIKQHASKQTRSAKPVVRGTADHTTETS